MGLRKVSDCITSGLAKQPRHVICDFGVAGANSGARLSVPHFGQWTTSINVGGRTRMKPIAVPNVREHTCGLPDFLKSPTQPAARTSVSR